MGKKSKWTDEMLIADAARFETRGEWARGSKSAYGAAWRRNILDVCCAHMRQALTSWTDETLIADAARFETRSEWERESSSAYTLATRRGLLDVCCAHMRQPRKLWTDEMLVADAARFETRKDWRRESPAAYVTAKRRDLLDMCCSGMMQLLTYWTDDDLITDAARFETRSEWRRATNGYAYSAAWKRGVLDVCCAHMIENQRSDNDAVYIWKALGWTYNGEQVYKVGVTSARLNDRRINAVANSADVEAEIVMLAKVNGKATDLESALLSIGHDPKYVDFDGCTEFRAMSDEQLKQALALIAQAAQETTDEESNVASEQE